MVTEDHPNSRAIAIGVWVLTGTRDENSEQAGISHLLEHLVFKGTKTRNAYQIAKSLEEVGGDLNAYTTKEYTCYHALVLKDHWEKALEVLCDLVSNMKVSSADYKTEKGVILQEIAMTDDSHEEIAHDLFFERALKNHNLGKPILGTVASVAKMSQRDVMAYYKKNYSGSNIIVSAAGNLEHDKFTKLTEKLLKTKKKTKLIIDRQKPKFHPIREVVEKQSEQVHFLMGLPSITFRDKYRFEAYIVNALLGGGMTSRLYQSVREKRGLVYTIYSSLNTFSDFGMMLVYAATESKNIPKLTNTVKKELQKLRDQGVKDSDTKLYKTQVTGSILLGTDDVENRMTSLGVNEMVFEKYKPVDEVIEEIQQVNTQTVNEYIDRNFDLSRTAGLIYGGGAGELTDWWKDLDLCKK